MQEQANQQERVFIAFPPKRENKTMSIVSRGLLTIGRKKLVDAQFAEEIISKTGFKPRIPKNWK